jgi:hypothetical protein
MPKTLTTLEKEAADAQAAFEAAQQAAELAREKEQQRRAERARAYDERLVGDYDEQQMFRAIRQARQDFDQAVAASYLGQAWIALKMAEARHAHYAEECNQAATRLGRHDHRVASRPAGNAAFEEIGRAVDRIVADRIADELDARDTAREIAITGR